MRSFGNPNLPDRLNGSVYRAGYNVGPKLRDCITRTGNINDDDAGPCGSFVASVFRAMQYYNPRAYSDLTKNYFTETYTADISNIYYGVGAPKYGNVGSLIYNEAAGNSTLPVFRWKYVPISVYFLKNGQRFYGDVTKPDDKPSTNNPPGEINNLGAQWNDNIEISRSNQISRPNLPVDYTLLWQQINYGSILMTIIEETKDGLPPTDPNDPNQVKRKYPHIQLVVGWGIKNYTQFTGQIYSSYDAIPGDKTLYVPYVMDRGEGGPFDFGTYDNTNHHQRRIVG